MDKLVSESVAAIRDLHGDAVDVDALSIVIHQTVSSNTRFPDNAVDHVIRRYAGLVESRQRAGAMSGGATPKFGYYFNELSSAKCYGDATRNHDRHTFQPGRDLRSNHFSAIHKQFLQKRREYIVAQQARYN